MKSRKELETLNEALKERRTELLKQIEKLENDLCLVEKSRDEICEENQRLKDLINYDFNQQFIYCIFVCKNKNRVVFWNNGRFEDRFTNINLSASPDATPIIDITYC